MSERINPHVLSKDDGLRNVDVFHNFDSERELNLYLDKCQLIGVGTNALVFLLPAPVECKESEALIRFEIQNCIGYDWTKQFVYQLTCNYPSFYSKLDNLSNKLETWVRPKSMKSQTSASRHRIKEQIAGHNSAFRRNPMLTMPVNSYYSFQDKWFGLRIKYLNGVSLGDAFPKAELENFVSTLLNDPNPNNVLVGITNSQVSEALIDISRFFPSDQSVGVEQPPRLYQLNIDKV